jgi:hypothetical protein
MTPPETPGVSATLYPERYATVENTDDSWLSIHLGQEDDGFIDIHQGDDHVCLSRDKAHAVLALLDAWLERGT